MIQLTTTKQFYVECVSLEKWGKMCHSNIKPRLLWHFIREVKRNMWDLGLAWEGSISMSLSHSRK